MSGGCSPGECLAFLHVHEVRRRGPQGSVGRQPDPQPLDDWLGDVSDDDWSEGAAELAEQRRAATVGAEPERDAERDGLAVSSAQVARPEARRGAVERRRVVAALALLLLVGIAAAAAVSFLRDGADEPVTQPPESQIVATPTLTETDPVQTTTSTTPTETTPAAPSDDAPTFTLPEGTKLQRGASVGESDLTVSTDPELIADLQRALTSAGYDPGSPDGIFGQNTEEAVVAFQQANGLSPDGIVGPETADALSTAVAGG